MISLISSAITALVSLIVFLHAPQLAKNNQTRPIRLGSLLVGSLASLLFIYKFIAQFLVIIPSGEIGLVQTFGQSSQKSLTPGLHWINPLGKVRTFSTRLEDIKETVDSTSKEGLGFKLDVSLQYRLDPDRASDVYKNLGDNQKQIISSRFRSLIRQITARHNLKDIYGDQRVVIAHDLAQSMKEQLKPLGFIVEATLLRNVILPENIQVAIQQKIIAKQKIEAIDLEIDLAKKEAQKERIEAQGKADAQKILATTLTDRAIQLKAIEATQKLAESPNSKIIVFGGGRDKLPVILSDK